MSKPSDDFPIMWIDVQRDFNVNEFLIEEALKNRPPVLAIPQLKEFTEDIGYNGQYDSYKHLLVFTEDKKDESVE